MMIILAVFCRNLEFNFRGRCVVFMSSPEDARRLVEYGNRRAVGGNIIKMSFVSYTCVLDKSYILKT